MAQVLQQTIVYRHPDHFAGWCANYGIWHWGDEVVVGFTVGHIDSAGGYHARDKTRPFMNQQARSLDGGITWEHESFNGVRPDGRGLSADEHMNPDLQLGTLPNLDAYLQTPSIPLKLNDADSAIMFARTGLERGARSFFYLSHDRCRTWGEPYHLPLFGQTGIMARTDYLIEGDHSALFFLTANKADGHEGKVMCVRTDDGGQTFKLVSHIGDEPAGTGDFAIMPASVRLHDGAILCATRCRRGADQSNWIDLYRSDDNGVSWQYINRPVQFEGVGNHNPATLHQLDDDRLVMTYGNRRAPFTIEAILSADDGQTWSEPIVLRSGGGNHDIGYPRTVVLKDNRLVTAYYFNEDAEGERFIEVTLWQA